MTKFLVLDIETSKVEIEDGILPWLSYGYLNLYSISGEKIKANFFVHGGNY